MQDNYLLYIVKKDEPLPMHGREAVEYFTKEMQKGNVDSMYFNYAVKRHFRPYDVTQVDRIQVCTTFLFNFIPCTVGRVWSRNSVSWNSAKFRGIPGTGILGMCLSSILEFQIPESEFRECLFWQELGTDQISFM